MNKYAEYSNWLMNHVENVKRAWKSVEDKFSSDSYPLDKINDLVSSHDISKTSEEEFYAYRLYFYPDENESPDEVKFNYAWLHHIHKNPHHWQYWLLTFDDIDSKDKHKTIALDMPLEYIIEMLCDWHSFSALDSKSTAFNFYHNMKDRMILSDRTRKVIEGLIDIFKDPLED